MYEAYNFVLHPYLTIPYKSSGYILAWFWQLLLQVTVMSSLKDKINEIEREDNPENNGKERSR